MKTSCILLLSVLFCFSCTLTETEEPCEVITDIDERVIDAVPYRNGQELTFLVSDGSVINTTVTREFINPRGVNFDCDEELYITFGGRYGDNIFEVNIDAFGGAGLQYDVDILADTFPSNRDRSIEIGLTTEGEISVANSVFKRIIPDTTINGRAYQNVLVKDHQNARVPILLYSYYNLEAGLIGVEKTDGTSIWLVEN